MHLPEGERVIPKQNLIANIKRTVNTYTSKKQKPGIIMLENLNFNKSPHTLASRQNTQTSDRKFIKQCGN